MDCFTPFSRDSESFITCRMSYKNVIYPLNVFIMRTPKEITRRLYVYICLLWNLTPRNGNGLIFFVIYTRGSLQLNVKLRLAHEMK